MHLFIEGERGSGKSTLILDLIRPYLYAAGGFGTIRLLGEDGRVKGYAQVAASELERVNDRYQEDLPGLFVERRGDHMVSRPEVLTEYTLPLLDQKGAAFYLMDEIGGVELQIPAWRQRLMALLEGEVPCIGVWKSPDNCVKLRRRIPGFEADYEQMRAWLKQNPNVCLLEARQDNREKVQAALERWKCVHLERLER